MAWVKYFLHSWNGLKKKYYYLKYLSREIFSPLPRDKVGGAPTVLEDTRGEERGIERKTTSSPGGGRSMAKQKGAS
jgi:hypothetical protein